MKKKRNDFIHHPVYPGGLRALRQYLATHLVYPQAALQHRIEGVVHVKYVVNDKGEVIDARVLHGIGYGCDEEALRLVRSLRFEVKKNRGLKLKFNKKIRVKFKLPSAALGPALSYTVTKSSAQRDDEESGGGYSYEIGY